MRVKVEPVDTWVSLIVDQELSPEARSRAVADFARREIAATKAGNRAALGRDTPETVFVDGRLGGRLDSVNPDRGVIIAEFELMPEVIEWVLQRLRDASPVISGDYRSGHTVYADGTEVNGALPVASEFAISNLVPYARKIEVGKTQSGRDFVIQVEPRIYERVAREARARFGNVVRIDYTFRAIVNARRQGPKPGRESTGAARQLRYPTITITPR